MFLSHQQTFGTTPTAPHPLRCTVSDRDLAYLIRTLLRFSAQRERQLRPRLLPRQRVARSQDLRSSLRQFRRVAVVGSVAHLVAKDPGGLLAMSPGGDRGKVHTREGQEAISQVPYWRQQRHDGAAVGLAAAGPIGSPATSHTDIVVSVGFSPRRTLVAGGSDKSVRLWDVATHLARAGQVQPIFELVLQAAHTRPRRRRFASNLLARPCSQTASQSMRQPAIIWGHPRTMLTATAPLSGVSEITDTEEVTGSNPVSPSSIIPGQRLIWLKITNPRAGCVQDHKPRFTERPVGTVLAM